MSDRNDVEGLHGLHQDLVALDESQLRNVDRLLTELEARVDDFKKLLDKSPKNEKSRNSLLSGAEALICPLCFRFIDCFAKYVFFV